VQAEYVCDADDTDNDESIVKLSRDLSEIEYRVSPYLNTVKRSYLFTNLGWVVASILIKSLQHITEINEYGARKRESIIYPFFRNLGNYASIEPEFMAPVFKRVNTYYGFICDTDPCKRMLARIKQGGVDPHLEFTLDEYSTAYTRTQDRQSEKWPTIEDEFNFHNNEEKAKRRKEIASKLPTGYF